MKKLILVPLAAASLALSGCATDYYGSSSYPSNTYRSGSYSSNDNYYGRNYGTVSYVRDVELARNSSGPGAGAVLGAVVGAAVGNQIGSGSGRALATVGGAVAGGVVGDRIQRNNRQGYEWGQEIQVRLDNGNTITVVQPGNHVYRGARVSVSGSGSSTRVQVIR